VVGAVRRTGEASRPLGHLLLDCLIRLWTTFAHRYYRHNILISIFNSANVFKIGFYTLRIVHLALLVFGSKSWVAFAHLHGIAEFCLAPAWVATE
jgi:hypothetical protein